MRGVWHEGRLEYPRPPFAPPLDDAMQLADAFRQRGRSELQLRRVDLVQFAVDDRRYPAPAAASLDPTGLERLADPRSDDDVRRALHDFIQVVDDAVFLSAARSEVRKAIGAARDIDELRHPAAGTDGRLIPFLEIDARPALVH